MYLEKISKLTDFVGLLKIHPTKHKQEVDPEVIMKPLGNCGLAQLGKHLQMRAKVDASGILQATVAVLHVNMLTDFSLINRKYSASPFLHSFHTITHFPSLACLA